MDGMTKGVLVIFLTIAVAVGALAGFQRYWIESHSKVVEVVVDYDDMRLISSLSRMKFDSLMDELKEIGITSIGLREQTPARAAESGEVIYFNGSGMERFSEISSYLSGIVRRGLIRPDRMYFISSSAEIHKRISDQLHNLLSKKYIDYIGPRIIAVDPNEAELRDAGIGFSQATVDYLGNKGFMVVPRIWNDTRYKILPKLNSLSSFSTVIFDGEEVAGYPDKINETAAALTSSGVRYGNIEIIKQDGDNQLKALMGLNIARVHSVPEDELKKIKKDEAVDRFSRAVRERSIRMIYLRPFLPPQIDADPAVYNLEYFDEVLTSLRNAGYHIGEASNPARQALKNWQIYAMGLGVISASLILLSFFMPLSLFAACALLILGAVAMVIIGPGRESFILQKLLALLATIVFPSYAVINNFSRKDRTADNLLTGSFSIMANVVLDTALGIFLVVGLLAYTNFMMASETFMGIKLALLAPIAIVGFYFFIKGDKDQIDIMSVYNRLKDAFNARIKVSNLLWAVLFLGVIFVFVARSGNFTLPVPGGEKSFRLLLEKILFVRPRTKEFLIGYPLLFLSAYLFLKGKKDWLWLILAIGVVGPISFMNSFCHIHTPLMYSIIRSFNGLALGAVVGLLAIMVADRFFAKPPS